MYSGQRFQAFPWDPVSLQSFLVQTCKQTHVLKSTHRLVNTVYSKENTAKHAQTVHDAGMVVVSVSTCVHLCAH